MKEHEEFQEFEPIAGLDEEFDDHYFDGDDLIEMEFFGDESLEAVTLEDGDFDEF